MSFEDMVDNGWTDRWKMDISQYFTLSTMCSGELKLSPKILKCHANPDAVVKVITIVPCTFVQTS